MHLCQSVISTSTSYLDRSHDRIKYSHDVSLDLSREYASVQAYLCENCGDHVVLERFGCEGRALSEFGTRNVSKEGV